MTAFLVVAGLICLVAAGIGVDWRVGLASLGAALIFTAWTSTTPHKPE